MKEFFGFGGYERPVEGFMSWQHLLFVTSLIIVMVILAIYLGLKNKNKDVTTKNKVLIYSALLIDSLELFKIILICFRSKDELAWLYDLPLFLCSIQLITIPLAAFSKGRVKEAALDFVLIFGLLGAILGTYGAGNNYGTYPVLSFDNVISGITHCISGFSALYIGISGLTSLNVSNFNTSNVTNMSSMFSFLGSSVVNLNLNLSMWNVSSVTNLSNMFDSFGYNKKQLK